jgi:predicted amidohydrolase
MTAYIINAAVLLASPAAYDTPKLADTTREEAAKKADIVLFVEAFIRDYLKDYDFCNDIPRCDPGIVLIRGESSIIDPLGNMLVKAGFEGEAITVAELNPRAIAWRKYALDVVGHYSRSDTVNPTVDAIPKLAVYASETTPGSKDRAFPYDGRR